MRKEMFLNNYTANKNILFLMNPLAWGSESDFSIS